MVTLTPRLRLRSKTLTLRNSDDLLYPQEDVEKKQLMFTCIKCDYTEVARTNCVSKRTLRRGDVDVEETETLDEIIFDPTYPRTNDIRCSECGNEEAVFIQETHPITEQVKLIFVCTNPMCRNQTYA